MGAKQCLDRITDEDHKVSVFHHLTHTIFQQFFFLMGLGAPGSATGSWSLKCFGHEANQKMYISVSCNPTSPVFCVPALNILRRF